MRLFLNNNYCVVVFSLTVVGMAGKICFKKILAAICCCEKFWNALDGCEEAILDFKLEIDGPTLSSFLCAENLREI